MKIGLFNWDHLKYEHQREKDSNVSSGEPSLAEMTRVAIEILKKNEGGFFLMVEAGKIDIAHHEGKVHNTIF